MLPIMAALALASGYGASASVSEKRLPVALQLVGDDGLTQKLSYSLKKTLSKHPALRLATASDQRTVTIESDTNVGWDKLAGRTVVIYTVYVHSREERGEPVTGVCFETAMSKCAKDILRITQIKARQQL